MELRAAWAGVWLLCGAQLIAAPRAFAQDVEHGAARPQLTPSGGTAARAAEIERLRSERAQIENYIPGFFMYAGGATAGSLWMGSAMMLAFECDPGTSDAGRERCEERDREIRKYALIGAAGAVVGIIGLVFVLNNHSRRKTIDARIRELQSDRARLRFDLRPAPGGGSLALRLRF